jgi:hypothetical protein
MAPIVWFGVAAAKQLTELFGDNSRAARRGWGVLPTRRHDAITLSYSIERRGAHFDAKVGEDESGPDNHQNDAQDVHHNCGLRKLDSTLQSRLHPAK